MGLRALYGNRFVMGWRRFVGAAARMAAVALIIVLCFRSASASLIITAQEEDGDVVFRWGGGTVSNSSLNLTGMSPWYTGISFNYQMGRINPTHNTIVGFSNSTYDTYINGLQFPPTGFGSGTDNGSGVFSPSGSKGFGVYYRVDSPGASYLTVPVGYDGNTNGGLGILPAGTLRFANSTFAGLGIDTSTTHTITTLPSSDTVTLRFVGVPRPEIVVETSFGVEIPDGGVCVFNGAPVGATNDVALTIRNVGEINLTGLEIAKDGPNASDFTVLSGPVAPVPPGTTTVFTIRFVPSRAGTRTASIHIASNDEDEDPFDLTFVGAGLEPEIAVEQPTGSSVADGSERDCGAVPLGRGVSLTFTVRNTGNSNLVPLMIDKDGANSDEFSIGAIGSTNLGSGASTSFDVTFTPSNDGVRTAAIHIYSNDADENPYDIFLTGRGLSAGNDCDGDGLNDVAEYEMAMLGFDWQVSQPERVSVLMSNAHLCELYSEEDFRSVYVGVPLIGVSNGAVVLELQLEKSNDLEHWTDFGEPVRWIEPASEKCFYRILFDGGGQP